ncbi:hypothetical protein ACIHCM_11580 [Streptomyces sp. NPDC052023]|uniref:hypothetical protein n=1 Tax=Streptomyces sp. NPDC052023 TaxID=3365681 RepID=UPI0037D2C7A9
MMRPPRALPWAALLIPVLVTGCGTATEPAAGAEAASRARASGIAPEHLYATGAAGFTLAQQSVGVYGGDGFSAVYVSQETGAHIQLTVDRGTMTAAGCPGRPVAGASGGTTKCVRDGDAWYRVTGGHREYAVPKDGHVVHVGGSAGVSRDVLREAALGAHRPSAGELDALLPSAAPAPTAPLERGDLPPVGDGAPRDEVGTSG